MTDYSELFKALMCGNDGKHPCRNNECPYWVYQWHGIGLCNVIKKDADAAYAIEELQAENTDIREELFVSQREYDNFVAVASMENAMLAKQIPNRGKWIMDGKYTRHCSICNESVAWPEKYCPNCGAKMMEVQDA